MRIVQVFLAVTVRLNELRRFANDDEGASLLEYALVLGIISAVAVAGLSVLGNHASATLSTAASSVAS